MNNDIKVISIGGRYVFVKELDENDIVWTPSLIQKKVENEFGIPEGYLFLKTRSRKFAIARFTYLYVLQEKLKIEPAVLRIIHGLKHDTCWYARERAIPAILESKYPRHLYIMISNILKKIVLWDLTEVQTILASKYAESAKVTEYSRNSLERSILVAQSTKQLNANPVMEQDELSEQ